MDTIAIGRVGNVLIHNPTPDLSARLWAEGMWCDSTLSPSISVLVGWDGMIHAAFDTADEESTGYWRPREES